MCSGIHCGVKQRLPGVVTHTVAEESARAGQIARCGPVTPADQRCEHAYLSPGIPIDAEGARLTAPSGAGLRQGVQNSVSGRIVNLSRQPEYRADRGEMD